MSNKRGVRGKTGSPLPPAVAIVRLVWGACVLFLVVAICVVPTGIARAPHLHVASAAALGPNERSAGNASVVADSLLLVVVLLLLLLLLLPSSFLSRLLLSLLMSLSRQQIKHQLR